MKYQKRTGSICISCGAFFSATAAAKFCWYCRKGPKYRQKTAAREGRIMYACPCGQENYNAFPGHQCGGCGALFEPAPKNTGKEEAQ